MHESGEAVDMGVGSTGVKPNWRQALEYAPRWLTLPAAGGLAFSATAALDVSLEFASRDLSTLSSGEVRRFVVAATGVSLLSGIVCGSVLAALDRLLSLVPYARARLVAVLALTSSLFAPFVIEAWHRPTLSSPVMRSITLAATVSGALFIATLAVWPTLRATPNRRRGRAIVAAGAGIAAVMAAHHDVVRIETTFRMTLLFVGAALLGIALSPFAHHLAKLHRMLAGALIGIWALYILKAPRDRRILSVHMLLGRDLLALASDAHLFREPPRAALVVEDDPEPGPPPAATAEGSGVLILSIDALRADVLRAYGNSRGLTPHLDRFFEGSVVFERAYAQYPSTMVSIPTLLTGRFLWYGNRNWRVFWRETPTLQSILSHSGYRTGAFSPHWNGRDEEGRWTDFAPTDFGFAAAMPPSKAPEKVAEILAQLRDGSRSFLWSHFGEPHDPYVVHPGFDFGRNAEDRYASEAAYVDDALGPLLDYLETRRDLIVWITADHGEAFSEHGARFHSSSLYDEQLRVPLALRAPGLRARRVSGVAEIMDIVPTTLGLLGVAPSRLDGKDLRSRIASRKGSEYAFGLVGRTAMVATGTHKLICDARVQGCEMYDLVHDPGEKRDLANTGLSVETRLLSKLIGFVRGEAVEPGTYLPPFREVLAERQARERAGGPMSEVLAIGENASRVWAARAAAERGRLLGDEAAELHRARFDTSPSLRLWSLLALARSGELDALDEIQALDLAKVDAPEQKAWIAIARYEAGDDGAIELVRASLRADADSRRVRAAIEAVGSRADARFAADLAALVRDEVFAEAAARALVTADPQRLSAQLADAIWQHRSRDVQAALVRIAGAFPDNAALGKSLLELLDTPVGELLSCETALAVTRFGKPLPSWTSAALLGPPGAPPLPYRVALTLTQTREPAWMLWVAVERVEHGNIPLDVRVNGHSVGTLEPRPDRGQEFDVPAGIVKDGPNDVEFVGTGPPPLLGGVVFLNSGGGANPDAGDAAGGPLP